MENEQLDFKVNDEWERFEKENPWVSFIPEFAKDSNDQKYMRRRGSSVSYKVVDEDKKVNLTYECTKCNGEIQGAKVAHPIWDGPFPGSGYGKCHYETVPYCPNCEEKPNFRGKPIEVDFKDMCQQFLKTGDYK